MSSRRQAVLRLRAETHRLYDAVGNAIVNQDEALTRHEFAIASTFRNEIANLAQRITDLDPVVDARTFADLQDHLWHLLFVFWQLLDDVLSTTMLPSDVRGRARCTPCIPPWLEHWLAAYIDVLRHGRAP